MKLLITFFAAMLCLTPQIFAQDNSNVSELFVHNEFSNNSDNDLLFVCRNSNDEASKLKEWESSILIDYKNQSHQVKSNYDVATDEVQILLKDQIRTIFPQKIVAIKVGQMILVPCEFEGQDALAYGYFQVVSSNRIDLLVRYENEGGTIRKSYYTRKKDEAAKLLKINKSYLIKNLKDDRTVQYIKDKKLNIKEEQDLIELFNYHNQLN